MVIVALTVTGFGVLVFKLIGDAEAGRTDAAASAIARTARGIELDAVRTAAPAARRAAGDPTLLAAIRAGDRQSADRAAARLRVAGSLARLQVTAGRRVLADAGAPDAIAPVRQPVVFAGSDRRALVLASTLRAGRLARLLAPPGGRVTVRLGGAVLAAAGRDTRADDHRTAVSSVRDFSGRRATVTISAPVDDNAAGVSRTAALAVLLAFAGLAVLAALAVSRGLHRQMEAFLQAARRIGEGDFTATVPVQGHDEFGQLGLQFNHMGEQLAARLEELRRERSRVRESARRIGRAFGSNLDRHALLELGVRTAVDAVQAEDGRASLLAGPGELTEAARTGTLARSGEALQSAERRALATDALAEAAHGDVHALAARLRPAGGGAVLGTLAVARTGLPFSRTDQELFGFVSGQAAAALDNVELHELVRRQAVTDEVTGLANHRRFQETLRAELERGRRFEHDVGLLLLDIDDFKRVNDEHGHQQGDEVLRAVAGALRTSSRDVDEPARYGGEEFAVILPETDREDAWHAGERVRKAIAALAVPQRGGGGTLGVTVSIGVAAGRGVPPAELVGAADRALYDAKRTGKNRTVRAEPSPAGRFSAG